jgi:hypothetical protein
MIRGVPVDSRGGVSKSIESWLRMNVAIGMRLTHDLSKPVS